MRNGVSESEIHDVTLTVNARLLEQNAHAHMNLLTSPAAPEHLHHFSSMKQNNFSPHWMICIEVGQERVKSMRQGVCFDDKSCKRRRADIIQYMPPLNISSDLHRLFLDTSDDWCLFHGAHIFSRV